jgi:hypothetical protein
VPYSINARSIQQDLEALPLAIRLTIGQKLKELARTASTRPNQSVMALLFSGDAGWFEVGDIRVRYVVDPRACEVRAVGSVRRAA